MPRPADAIVRSEVKLLALPFVNRPITLCKSDCFRGGILWKKSEKDQARVPRSVGQGARHSICWRRKVTRGAADVTRKVRDGDRQREP